ncbi:3-hydroxyisobutyrate dehydrogenase [Maritalea mediterranea]|uniref:3-hydroxyisobutyrate dehydrogenase n=1 Tax=Maritalea mediterranea TaxID=2909667 RepID=A0ABS9E5C9_9HYPH|nr:3-hydroxyisobutyrate dehydrogenase [Maritalea mediterranea]MCF4097124.1 3-hydroxyisobutyrate dehydrogenase [Maritalea mediterranea]
MKIAFIGLGNMGGPMAANLSTAGHEVLGFDLNQEIAQKAAAKGVQLAHSAEGAVEGADVVISMLPNGNIVLSVYKQLLGLANKGTVFLDCSTIDVKSAEEAHAMAKEAGMLSLDAPVSGGVGGAEAGTLTFMVGGSDDAYGKAKPLFDIMGQKAVHCGAGGAGQAAKICNNMLLAISMIGTAEAFNLADKLNLDKSALFDVISTSSGSCWSVNTYCPVPGVGPESPADRDYKPGFDASLMLKDLKLSQDAASQTDSATPLGAHATSLYEKYVEKHGVGHDFSGIINDLDALDKS